MCLVWGQIAAGTASNAIPRLGTLRGTLRVLDRAAWERAPALVERLVQELVAPFGAEATVTYERGVPPVVNDLGATSVLSAAVRTAIGPAAAVPTPQSLGGEDFAWYLDHVPGAMARLGVKPVGAERAPDLHQPAFDVDEAAIGVGVRVLVAAALGALATM
jgi:metal-dependent amidase/aminoacylase/carboxypeptidase family protein